MLPTIHRGQTSCIMTWQSPPNREYTPFLPSENALNSYVGFNAGNHLQYPVTYNVYGSKKTIQQAYDLCEVCIFHIFYIADIFPTCMPSNSYWSSEFMWKCLKYMKMMRIDTNFDKEWHLMVPTFITKWSFLASTRRKTKLLNSFQNYLNFGRRIQCNWKAEVNNF